MSDQRQRAIAKAYDLKHASRDFAIFQDETSVMLARELLELVGEMAVTETALVSREQHIKNLFTERDAALAKLEKAHETIESVRADIHIEHCDEDSHCQWCEQLTTSVR